MSTTLRLHTVFKTVIFFQFAFFSRMDPGGPLSAQETILVTLVTQRQQLALHITRKKNQDLTMLE